MCSMWFTVDMYNVCVFLCTLIVCVCKCSCTVHASCMMAVFNLHYTNVCSIKHIHVQYVLKLCVYISCVQLSWMPSTLMSETSCRSTEVTWFLSAYIGPSAVAVGDSSTLLTV